MILTPPSLRGPNNQGPNSLLREHYIPPPYSFQTLFSIFLQIFCLIHSYHRVSVQLMVCYHWLPEMRCEYARHRRACGQRPSSADVDPSEVGSGGWCESHYSLRHRDRQDSASA